MKMKWNHFKSKLLLKYTLSYISIFLIPLVILTFIIYQNATDTLRSEIEHTNVNQLTQAMTVIDERMKELHEIASRIAYDGQLTPYLVHHPYYSRDAISTLEKYKATSSIINELFLYFRGEDLIYSAKGLEDLSVFLGRYKFHSWKKEDFINDLNNVRFPTMRPSELVDRNGQLQQSLMAYLVPITPNKPYPHGTVMYLIPESSLTGLIDSILTDYQGMTYIFDDNGHVLAANRHGEPVTPDEVNALYQLTSGIHSITLNQEQHSVVSVKSEDNGWTYVTAMPSKQFQERILHIRTFILLVFSVVVVMGTLIAILLARRQYHPISDLMEIVKLKTLTERSSEPPASNELDWIKKTLHNYIKRIDIQEPYARNQYLLMLLKYGHSRDYTAEVQSMLGIRFPHSHYFVIHISWDQTAKAEPHDAELQEEPVPSIVPLFTDISIPEHAASAYGVELPQPEQLALIIGFDADNEDPSVLYERRVQIVEAVRSRIRSNSPVPLAIGVGTAYTSPEQLHQSYIEASSALDFCMLNNQESTGFFDKLSEVQDPAFWIPKDLLLKLNQSLKQGSYNVAAQTIHTAITSLKTEKIPVALLRCICFDIMNTMLKMASELGIHHVVKQLPQLTSFDSLEELEKKLNVLAAEICDHVERKSVYEENTLLNKIIAYIDENFTDYTLSLGTISAKFSISASYFSRSFKEKVGTNFSQYIWQKRMDEVIRQLIQTSDPLKDIITRVGYLDTPNFIRKFKKEMGCTPGQYRKQYGNSGAAELADDEED